ncbi:MAG: hypothetical protein JWM68_1832 [Verrucomicrobiales bacterium]|nr:hypothetical protein [Verrucomicrobiales bacterium]
MCHAGKFFLCPMRVGGRQELSQLKRERDVGFIFLQRLVSIWQQMRCGFQSAQCAGWIRPNHAVSIGPFERAGRSAVPDVCIHFNFIDRIVRLLPVFNGPLIFRTVNLPKIIDAGILRGWCATGGETWQSQGCENTDDDNHEDNFHDRKARGRTCFGLHDVRETVHRVAFVNAPIFSRINDDSALVNSYSDSYSATIDFNMARDAVRLSKCSMCRLDSSQSRRKYRSL